MLIFRKRLDSVKMVEGDRTLEEALGRDPKGLQPILRGRGTSCEYSIDVG